MNLTTEQKWGLGALLLVVLLTFSNGRRDETPDEPDDTEQVADMNAAFTGEHGRSQKQVRADADRLADICAATADAIEYDGRKNMRLKSGSQVNDTRATIREYVEKGGSFVAVYPHLGAAIDTFMEARVGTDDDTLTDKSRRAWVRAYRDLARSLNKTARSF